MKRRTFLKSSVAACLAAPALEQTSRAADAKGAREHYELRVYTMKPEKQPIIDAYLSKAFIPALGRLGIGPVGVFTELSGQNKAPAAATPAAGATPAPPTGKLQVYVLIVLKSAEQAATLPARLAADPEYIKAAGDYWNAPANDRVYERIETSLHAAIAGMPAIAKTETTTNPRVINLRIYESPSERAAAKKIEMFNEHELAIFRKVGLTPLLFGETIIGSKMPNLTYMLHFPDDAARNAAWGKFGGDPDWKKLSSIPEYTDKELITNITNKILKTTDYSQI